MKQCLVKHFNVFMFDALNEMSFAVPNKFTRLPLYRTIQFVPMLTPPMAVIVGKSLFYVIKGLSMLSTVLGNSRLDILVPLRALAPRYDMLDPIASIATMFLSFTLMLDKLLSIMTTAGEYALAYLWLTSPLSL